VPRVLLLARYFPPIGGAGVHRTLGSVRHLPAHGFDPIVVTGPGGRRGRWDAHDAQLLERIPGGAEIHRVPGTEPDPPTGPAARLERMRPGIHGWVRWWIDAAVALGREVGDDADVVYTSCAPYHTALAGARLAAELGVPWIADLEDPWALDEMRVHQTGLHRAVDLRQMRRALGSASAVVMAAPEAAARVRRSMPELAGRTVTGIPIGFEPDDFDVAVEPRDPGVLRIVHTGSMHTDFGLRLRRTRRARRVLGGMADGLDVLPRSHVFLIQAIERLLAGDPSLAGRIELHLAGSMTAEDLAAADGRPFVHVAGRLPHRETVALMRSADLLFLPMHDLPAGTRAGLIPYKTFEYLGAERPILAALPDGDTRDLLAPLDHVTIVRPTDIDGMAAALRSAIAAGPGVEVARRIGSPALRPYERSTCVARIADVLEQVLATTGAGHGGLRPSLAGSGQSVR
jgi:hypothetical protein